MALRKIFIYSVLLIPTVIGREPTGLPSCATTCPRGLKNCDNSCYMNATLQCLYNMSSLRGFLIKNKESYKPESPTRALITFFETAQKSTKSELDSFMERIYSKTFGKLMQDRTGAKTATTQQDAQEFLGLILEYLQEDTNDKATKQAVEKLYRLDLSSTIMCKDNQGKMLQSETKLGHEYLLSVEITGHTLEDCLKSFFAEEKLDSGNNCSWCKNLNGDGYRTYKFNAAEYLIIQLKLFEGEQVKNSKGEPVYTFKKIMTPVVVPDILDDLMPYSEKQATAEYQLISSAVHIGSSVSGGHYTAYVWSEEEKKWYYCNDSVITPNSRPPFIDKGKGWKPVKGDSGRPYMLFYKRIEKQEKPAVTPRTGQPVSTVAQDLTELAQELIILAQRMGG